MSFREGAAGIGIVKGDAGAAVRFPGKRGVLRDQGETFGATTAQILALVDCLLGQGVATVVREATSDYWRPFYFVMGDVRSVLPPGWGAVARVRL